MSPYTTSVQLLSSSLCHHTQYFPSEKLQVPRNIDWVVRTVVMKSMTDAGSEHQHAVLYKAWPADHALAAQGAWVVASLSVASHWQAAASHVSAQHGSLNSRTACMCSAVLCSLTWRIFKIMQLFWLQAECCSSVEFEAKAMRYLQFRNPYV